MSKQVIVSIAREYAAGGHLVAKIISEKYNLPIYDSTMLDKIAQEKGIDISELQKYEGRPKSILFSRTVAGFNNSPADVVAQMEFDFIRDKAEAGESFIVIGRCANSILKDYDSLISIFITSDMPFKLSRIKGYFPDMTDKEIERMIVFNNRKRKAFHNSYCREKWGDSRYYELTVSTAKIGIEGAADVIDKYISAKLSVED